MTASPTAQWQHYVGGAQCSVDPETDDPVGTTLCVNPREWLGSRSRKDDFPCPTGPTGSWRWDHHLIHCEEARGKCVCDFQDPLWEMQRSFPSPCSLNADFYFQKRQHKLELLFSQGTSYSLIGMESEE